MANSAFDHSPTITIPGSSTNTALVRWSGTGADTFTDSTILVGSTTMGLAADTDLLTFGSGTLAITGAVTGVTDLTASGAVSGGTLAGTVSTATQNSITTMTGLTTVGTVGTGVWNGTAIAQAYIDAEAINESKMQVSNAPTNGYVLTARDGVTGGFTWEAAAAGGGAGAVTRLGGITSESTTTSSSPTDLVSITSLSVPGTTPIMHSLPFRKGYDHGNAGGYVNVGLKINSTRISSAIFGRTDTTNEHQSGHAFGAMSARDTNYVGGCSASTWVHAKGDDGVARQHQTEPGLDLNALYITDTVTTYALNCHSTASMPLGIDHFHIYTLAVS